MGLFRYEAVDKAGRVLHGAMDASDERQVADRLTKMGYSARAVYPANQSRTVQTAVARPQPTSSATPAAAPPGAPVSVRSAVPLSTLAAFFRQLSTLVKSGIPLHQSFVDLAAFTRQKHLARVLPRMRDAVQSGQKLSGAMAAHPGVFPVWATASVWAGEMSGKLEIALEEVAFELEREASDTRAGGLWWFITKLTIVSCVIILPLCDVSSWLNTMNTSLTDIITRVTAITLRWTPLAIAVTALFIAWTSIKRVPSVRLALDGILVHVPVWGNLHKYRGLARFLHVLDMLYTAGISPGTAWDAASLTVKNNDIARKLKAARVRHPNVERAADLFQSSGVFAMEDVGMAEVGEKSGRLPESLGQLSRIYEERADHSRAIGRAWSISLLITSQIAVSGIATIIMVYSYFVKLPKGLGIDW